MDTNKVKTAFLKAYKSGNKMELLQRVYLLTAGGFIVLAGLVALLNQAVGVGLLIVPLVAGVAYAMNMVTWSVVESAAKSMKSSSSKKKK